MALASTGVFEVRAGGSDSNAGYFNPSGGSPGTDYSQQDAAQVTIDGATITATVQATTTQLLIAGTSVTAAWNRNGLRITGGTATAGLYEITAVNTGTNVITLDRSAGSSTQTATGAMGGGFASPGQAAAFAVSDSKVFVKYSASVYALTSASTNVSGGCVSQSSANFYLIGYDTTRTVNNTDANRPTLQMQGISSAVGVAVYRCAANIIVDCNATTSSTGFSSGLYNRVAIRCTAKGFKTAGFSGAGSFYFCSAEDATAGAGFTTGSLHVGCVSRDLSGRGFDSIQAAFGCVALRCTDGFHGTASGTLAVRCAAVSNSGVGFYFPNGPGAALNCIAYGNGGYGIDGGAFLNPPQGSYAYGCAAGSNTSGAIRMAINASPITLTADPFTDKTNNNLALNDTAGGGALLRAAGFPSQPFGLSTTNYADVGPFQHQDAGGGGGGGNLLGNGTLVSA